MGLGAIKDALADDGAGLNGLAGATAVAMLVLPQLSWAFRFCPGGRGRRFDRRYVENRGVHCL